MLIYKNGGKTQTFDMDKLIRALRATRKNVHSEEDAVKRGIAAQEISVAICAVFLKNRKKPKTSKMIREAALSVLMDKDKDMALAYILYRITMQLKALGYPLTYKDIRSLFDGEYKV